MRQEKRCVIAFAAANGDWACCEKYIVNVCLILLVEDADSLNRAGRNIGNLRPASAPQAAFPLNSCLGSHPTQSRLLLRIQPLTAG